MASKLETLWANAVVAHTKRKHRVPADLTADLVRALDEYEKNVLRELGSLVSQETLGSLESRVARHKTSAEQTLTNAGNLYAQVFHTLTNAIQDRARIDWVDSADRFKLLLFRIVTAIGIATVIVLANYCSVRFLGTPISLIRL